MSAIVFDTSDLAALVHRVVQESLELITTFVAEPCSMDDLSWNGGQGAAYFASIGISGQYAGSLYLVTSKDTGRNFRNALLQDNGEDDEGVGDVVGEILNILASSLQNAISSQEQIIQLAIPCVIEAADWPKQANTLSYAFGCTRFHTPAGPLEVGLQLIPQESS